MIGLADSFTTPVGNCARCGRYHSRVQFRKFETPCQDWTHWGSCPNTGEPILLQYDPVTPEAKPSADPENPQ